MKAHETTEERKIDQAVSWAFWVAKDLPSGTISRKWISNLLKRLERWVPRNWKKNPNEKLIESEGKLHYPKKNHQGNFGSTTEAKCSSNCRPP